ncbi:bifunctional 2-polyprenyl-6-hydroxyphenol methylase/3-demethylubiquinol 3-O-methyltransferase UbiG [Legionella gresilensis]|uniref:bifunctional 2-polyprenyl-6-hydroxyphenol methylase/3-demethylubiquinol 3-O-methyltransferase UbiG n=1 Tax=Legionella gresilensis TaxID=91823 RepID=UPI001040EC16|nr:bifunctional 2-polyprenyl-6-hydroxyphenol methylase/3-demethylubiquinol 3-O-methyltransferase UbiG [Legionella gresilensis]
MNNQDQSSINEHEVAKFAKLSLQWWNTEGDLKTLHDINPTRLAFIKDYTKLAKKNILDLGCGGGILSEALAREGALVTGIDAEHQAIEVAKEHASMNHLDINYICMPIEDYEATPFDIITCMEMLEHVSEPYWVIKHCARLLKPGGLLFLSTINRTLKAYAAAIVAAEYLLGLLPKQTHDYSKFIKPAELAAMLRAEGFEVITIKGMTYNPLIRRASLQNSVSVNYLMYCRKL